MARPIQSPRMTRTMQEAMQRRLQPTDPDTTSVLSVPITHNEYSALMQACRRSGFRESDLLRAGLAHILSLYGLGVEPPSEMVPVPDAMAYAPAIEALQKAPSTRYLEAAPTSSFTGDVLINTRYNIALRAHAATHYAKQKGRGSNNSGGLAPLVSVALDLLYTFLDLPKPTKELSRRDRMRLLCMYTGHTMAASNLYRLALHLYMKHHNVFSADAPDLANLTK